MLRRAAGLAFLCVATEAWSPAAPIMAHRLHATQQTSRAVVARRVPQQPQAVLGFSARRQAVPRPARSLSLLVKTIFSTLFSLICFSAKALAASNGLRTALPTFLTGDVVKFGLIAGACGYFFFSSDDGPKGGLCVTPTDDNTAALPKGLRKDAAPDDAAPSDDGLMGDLQKRMQALAAEREAADARDSESSSFDSGGTATLEPPKPSDAVLSGGLLEDGPSVDFPVGFPLRDMPSGDAKLSQPAEEEDMPPAASDADIKMLERMFGINKEDD